MYKKYLSIIIPVFNEAENIKPIYNNVINFISYEKVDFELIFINDGSYDNTENEVLKLAKIDNNIKYIKNNKNLGIFESWKIGLKNSDGELACFIDGDLQTNPNQISLLLRSFENNNCDIVKGSRYDFIEKLSFRKIYSILLNYILNFLFMMKSSDNKSGFVLGRTEDLTDILSFKRKYFYGQTFISVSAFSKGYTILEHPSIFEKRKNNTSFIQLFPLKLIFLVLIDIASAFFEFNFFTKKNNELERFLIKKNKSFSDNNFTNNLFWKLYVFLTPFHKFNIERSFNNKLKSLLKSQYLTNEELKEYQLVKLKKIIRHCYGNIPYYTKIFNQVGLHPRLIQSLEDLRKIPPLEKNIVKKNSGFELLDKKINLKKTYKISTSGSTGEPLNLYVNFDQLEWRFATTIRGFTWAGWFPFLKNIRLWHQTLGLNTMQIAKERIDMYLSNRKFFPAYEFDTSKTMKLIEYLSSQKNCILDGYAESFEYIARTIKNTNIKKKFNIKSIITSAQTLSKDTKTNIENFFQTKVFDKYGAREFSGIAYENDEFNGHLVNMESYILEVVEKKNSETNRKIGEILITDLNNTAMPLIRYKIGDLAEIKKFELEKCKLKFDRIGDIEGRITSIINLPEKKWLPGTFFAHFFKDYEDYILRYQIIQTTINEIEIHIVPTDSYNLTIQNKIETKISIYLKNISIKFLLKNSIDMVKTGKFNSVINRLKNNE